MSFGLSHGRSLNVEGVGIDQRDLPPLEHGRIDPRQWFGHSDHRLEIEVGCGKGTFLLQQSRLHPAINYLGIEWAGEFYRFAADRMRRHQTKTVKVLRADATEFLRHRCVDGVAGAIHLYFSDPWPKKRHHKRRVVQDRTLEDFHRVLQPGGELHLVTDHEELWAWYEDHAARHANLFVRQDFRAPASAGADEVVGSNFERKYKREARILFAMTLVRR